jgi:hypothetical protein
VPIKEKQAEQGKLTTLQSWRPPSWAGAHAMITASTGPALLTRRIVLPIHSWPVICHAIALKVRFRDGEQVDIVWLL